MTERFTVYHNELVLKDTTPREPFVKKDKMV